MIINVGARSDIVNYYSKWLLNRLNEGYAYSRNPLFKNNVSKLSLKPEDVDCLIFCSKNYKPILENMEEINKKYRILCHYTITAYGKDVEPNVPDIDESIKTLIELSQIIGKQKIIWRYDPVLLTENYTIEKHFETFEYIAKHISKHVQRCIFSFVEMYKKLDKNMPDIIPLTDDDKLELVDGLAKISKKYNLYTQTCGSDEDYEKRGIHLSGCITSEILEEANNIEYKQSKAKPLRKGCHCLPNRDIGAYDTCLNGCKYCYANKNPELARNNLKLHDENSPLLIGNIKKTDKISVAKPRTFIKKSKNARLI